MILGDIIDQGIAGGSVAGTFLVILWLVKVLVTSSSDNATASSKALAAAEERFKEDIRIAVAASEEKCEAKLNALHSRMDIISNAIRELAGQYPEDLYLKFVIATLNEGEHQT